MNGGVKPLTKEEFERYLLEVYDEVGDYDAKFSREYYEICFLVSRAACGLFAKYNNVPLHITDDPFGCNSYLYGHRIAFVNSNYIPSYDGEFYLIKPVIVCNRINHFPIESSPGDYVFCNGFLKQVRHIDYMDGSRCIGITDFDVELSKNYIMSDTDKEQTFCSTFRDIKNRNQKRDEWVKNVDNSMINDYLASLTIT